MSEEKKTFEDLAMEVKAIADKVADELDLATEDYSHMPSERTLMVAAVGIMQGLLRLYHALAATENDFTHDEYSWGVYENISDELQNASKCIGMALEAQNYVDDTFKLFTEVIDSMEAIDNTIKDYDDSPKQREYKLALDKNLD